MIGSYNSGVAGKGGGKMLLTFILRLFFHLVGNMHPSQVGTLGVWRDSSHPPSFRNVSYASFWGKHLFSACLNS